MSKPTRSKRIESNYQLFKAELDYIFSEDDLSIDEIAERYEINRDTVRSYATTHGWTKKRRVLKVILKEQLFVHTLRDFLKSYINPSDCLDLLEKSIRLSISKLLSLIDDLRNVDELLTASRTITELIRNYQALQIEKLKELDYAVHLKDRIMNESSEASIQTNVEDDLKLLISNYLHELVVKEASLKDPALVLESSELE